LAKRYNTTVEEILEVNPNLDPYNVQIGQKICIPEDTSEDCPKGTFSYTIKSGDTLYNIAKKYNTTVEEILKVNPGINPYNLQVGQKICIPDEEPAVDCDGMYYVVRPGRSEEHTSELQSRFDLVCRLLLEKKKHTQCNK